MTSYREYGIEDRWVAAVAIFLCTLVIVAVVRRLITWRAGKWADRTSTVWDDAAVDALRETRWWFVIALAAFCGSLALVFEYERTRDIIQSVMVLILLLQAALWGKTLIRSASTRYVGVRRQNDPAAAMTISALAMIGNIALMVILFLLALDNVGVEVAALVAGLGVGGIAVALAVQNILGDLLASLSIVFDKPFVPGDFIIVGDQMGTVQHIGLKTTRVASLSGEELVFANNDLLQSRVRNFRKMSERRVAFTVGVTYQTPRERLRQIPDILADSVQQQQAVRFDRSHFRDFGASALNFETVYYVLGSDYNQFMDVQQSINLAIHEAFEQLQIEFAYPTQTIFLEQGSTEHESANLGPAGPEPVGSSSGGHGLVRPQRRSE